MRVAALTLLITSLVLAATAGRSAARQTAVAACGSDYWPLKTFSDPLRKKVNLTPKDTTLTEITSPVHPQPTPTTRDTPFELQVWRVTVQITEFKREGDSDIHLILFDVGGYGIAEMPAAACVPKKARARKAIINARKKFEAACGKATSSWQQLGAVVMISGVRLLGQAAHPEPSRSELRGATSGYGDQVHIRLRRLELGASNRMDLVRARTTPPPVAGAPADPRFGRRALRAN